MVVKIEGRQLAHPNAAGLELCSVTVPTRWAAGRPRALDRDDRGAVSVHHHPCRGGEMLGLEDKWKFVTELSSHPGQPRSL